MSLSSDLPIGTELRGYRIEALVGRGGMGLVYRASDLRLERPVALKLVAPELAGDERFRGRFLRESRLAASLDHPNVIPIYETGEWEGQLFIAMRYVEGKDLKSLLADMGKLSAERALAICSQVADALDAAHAKGLVHRDVKPANVLLDEREHAYLCDFGLTKQLAGASTQTGQLVGTLEYLAPEQIRGEAVDGRTDEYGLACVLYECLSGKPPVQGATEAEVLWAHMQAEPPALRAYPALAPIFRQALAKTKEARYRSCGELMEAVAAALGLARPTSPRRPLFPPSVLRRGRALVLVGALILAGGLTTAIVELTGGGSGGFAPLTPNALGAIDPKTNRLAAQISLAGGPARLASGGRFVWIGGDESGTVSGLDSSTGTVTKLVATGGFPSDVAVGEGSVWVVDGRSGLLTEIDPAYGTVKRRIRVADPNPAYDKSRDTLDPSSVAAGAGSIWLTDGSRRLTRIDATTAKVVERIDVRQPLDGVAVGGGDIWAISGVSATAIRLDRRGRVTVRIPIVSKPGFESPYPLEVRVGEGFVWVLNGNTASITKIDPEQRAVSATISLGADRGPARLAVGDGAAWVANSDGTLARIDASTNAVTTIPVAHNLRDVAVGDSAVWVTAGSGLAGVASANVSAARVRALPSSFCSPVYFAGGGQPQYLIASDLPLQGSGTIIPQLGQAIQFLLRQHRFRAGRYAVGYQSCDDSTAQLGHWAASRCTEDAHAYASDRSVIGVVGTVNSPCSAIELPILNRAPQGPLAMISPANTYVGLTHSGRGTAPDEPDRYYPTGRRSYVRIVAADDVQGAADVVFARQLGVRSVYTLNDGESYGVSLTGDFEATAKKLGLELAGSSTWKATARDYKALSARIKRSGAQAVFLAGYLESNGDTLIRDLRAGLGPRVRIMASDGFGNFSRLVKSAGAAVEGMTVSLAGVPIERLPERGKAFARAFGGAVGEIPFSYSVYAAQAAEVLLDAIARSDGTRASVTAQLFKTKVSSGLTGSFSIDRNGDPTAGPVTIYRIVRGTPRVLQVITPPPRLVGAA